MQQDIEGKSGRVTHDVDRHPRDHKSVIVHVKTTRRPWSYIQWKAS